MALEIHRLSANSSLEESAWDQFVGSLPSGTIFHLSTWRRVVEEVFQLPSHYLAALEGGEIRGVLPLFEVHGILSGHVLISVLYGVYGGLCAADPEARRVLLEAARQLAICRRVRHIELRHLYDLAPGLPTKSLYAAFEKALDPDPEVNFAAIPRKQRRMIRQGIKHGLDSRSGWEHLGGFYEVFVANKRRLGSPPFPRRLFETIRDRFGKDAHLLTVWHKGQMVAGVISLFYRDRVMPYYGATLPEALNLAVSDFMYWELMRDACLAGYRVFDFGRSREGSGSYDFKRHWGFDPKPLAYQYVLVNGRGIPNVSPSNPRFRLFIETWKRLPLPITRWVGPALTRWLPVD